MAHRLLLLINSLEGGGAEKVFVTLAGHLARSHRGEICIATLDDSPDAYAAPDGVRRVWLDCRGGFLRSITAVRRLVAEWKPDIVLSFLTRANCAAILARGEGRFRCVVSERIHTTSHLGTGLRGRVLQRIVALLYPRADRVIAVSEGVRDELIRRYGVGAERVVSIPNPVPVEDLRARGREQPAIVLPSDFLVAVGRLVPGKGGETLLRAFARQSNKGRALVILGEGPERERLAALAETLGIGARLYMPGYLANPQSVVARASAYVSASRGEGFPNALVEAMALGRAVISTDCHSGPSEILADRPAGLVAGLDRAPWGILVPVDDVEALSRAMDLVDDSVIRSDLERAAKERVLRYAPAEIFARYEAELQP